MDQPQNNQFGVTLKRSQFQYPLDLPSRGALKLALEDVEKDVIRKRNRFPLIIPSGATSFFVASDYMVLTGAAAVTIATIKGGKEGQILTLDFVDANITITDTGTGAVDTVNLNSAFTSAANVVIQLLHNGTSWKEVSRSSSSGGFTSRVSAYNAGTQSITANTSTKVTFDTEVYDGDGEFATSTFTAGATGYYAVLVYIFWSTPSNPDQLQIYIKVNGSTLTTTIFNATGTGDVGTMAHDILNLTAGDTVEIYVERQDTDNIGSATRNFGNRLQIHRLS